MALDKISYLTKRNKSTSTLGHEERRLAGGMHFLRAMGDRRMFGGGSELPGPMKELQILISYTHDTFILYTRY